MAIYSAYLPADGELERARFVSDSPALAALIVPAIYLAWHKLWWPLAWYFLAASSLTLLASLVSHPLLAALSALPGFFLMVQGRDLVRNRWESDGWQEVASIEASSQSDAEFRFFANMPTGTASCQPLGQPREAPQEIQALPADATQSRDLPQ